MLPKHLYSQLKTLKLLLDRNPKNKTEFWALVKATPRFVRVISEFALNSILNRDIPLSTKAKSQLSFYKNKYLILADKKISLTEKRELITKKGHLFVLPLLSAILPTIIKHVERETDASNPN